MDFQFFRNYSNGDLKLFIEKGVSVNAKKNLPNSSFLQFTCAV